MEQFNQRNCQQHVKLERTVSQEANMNSMSFLLEEVKSLDKMSLED